MSSELACVYVSAIDSALVERVVSAANDNSYKHITIILQLTEIPDVDHLCRILCAGYEVFSQATLPFISDFDILLLPTQGCGDIAHLSQLPVIGQNISLVKDDSVSRPDWMNKVKHCVLGGTFDHLHSGHKLMLTIATLSCTESLAIGVTSSSMLVNKRYGFMLEDLQTRMENVKAIVKLIKPEIHVYCEELVDIYGPSTRAEIGALVVSQETKSGGALVNAKRIELGRDPAELIIIPLVSSTSNTSKLSSTWIRMVGALRMKWFDLMKTLGVAEGFSLDWWKRIASRYSQVHRRYHTLKHLSDMFDLLEKFGGSSTHIVLAIWFHDVEYNSHCCDNEDKSSSMLNLFLTEANAPDELFFSVAMITATSRHEIPKDIPASLLYDVELFLDLDLSILGASPEAYLEYSTQVRQEYSHVPDPVFNSSRSTVLRSFHGRKHIYYTQAFRDAFEEQANINLNRELIMLSAHETD